MLKMAVPRKRKQGRPKRRYSLIMEEEDECWTSAEDSEEERELEIALYSQIHFDTAPEHARVENYHSMDSGNISFDVGVEEISLPLKIGTMEKRGSGNDVCDFVSRSKQHSEFRKELERANNLDTIYVTSSDDDDSVEIISSETIRDDPVCNRNQADDDECIFLEMSTPEKDKGNRLIDEDSKEASLETKILSSNDNGCKNSSSTQTDKAQDVIVPISNSPSETVFRQSSGRVVPIECDQSQKDDFMDDDDIMILDAVIQLEESLPINALKEKPHLVPTKSTDHISQIAEENGPLHDKKNVSSALPSEPPEACSTTTERPNESCNILPFTITKAPIQMDKKPSSGESDSLVKEPLCTVVQDKKKLVRSKRPFKMASEKLDFLQFSENVKTFDKDVIRLKKKRLSKQEAAVIPRKPPVLLRKPPVVKVSYQQDSDTNTDYSDSDLSITSTPKKVSLNRKEIQTGNSVRKKVRDLGENDSSSSSSSSDSDNECPTSVSTSEKSCDVNRKIKLKKRKQLKESGQSSSIDNEVEAERTSEESDTASSVSSHTADLDKGAMHNPALDFNIEGGVESLLKSQQEMADGEKWQISDKDRYQIPVTMSRYFSPLSFTCRNCNKEGHKAANCPEPRKSICIFCGRMGHVYQACPDSMCYKCNEPGHQYNDCRERRRGQRTMCDRCWMPGHSTEDCPDLWRQYHLTCEPDKGKIQTSSKKHSNPKVYCFNCGKEGHLGYECNSPMMNFHVIPNYPFIAKYSTGGPKENRNTRRKKERQAKEKKKKRYDQDYDRNKKRGKTDYENEYWEDIEREDVEKTAHGSKRKGHSHHEEQEIYKSSRGKKHQRIHEDKAGKFHKENPEEDKRHRSKRGIVTGTTVFRFQNSTYQDYEDYSPPPKRRLSHGNKDSKNNLHHYHSADQPPVKDYRSRRNHHEYDINRDDEFINHQVFNNEWWNEDQSTEPRKKGKKKSSRKKTTSKSMQNTEANNFEYDDMYSEYPVYQYDNNQRESEAYGSSRRHVLSHKIQQSVPTSKREVNVPNSYHKPNYKSGYHRHNKKKNKSGFQMNSHFQSLSKSCRK